MIKNYQILEECNPAGFYYIRLTSGDHEGIIYSYGRVSLLEEGDNVKLSFSYDILDNNGKEIKSSFEEELGGILQDILAEQLAKNEVVYKGGVDENRTEDSNESDT
jgi:ABC-type antimicrobial peptide transport system permease subunit